LAKALCYGSRRCPCTHTALSGDTRHWWPTLIMKQQK
jgi:hypothetical protein